MKKKNYIKRALMMSTFAAAVFLVTSCEDDKTRSADTKAIAEERNDEKFDKNKSEKDAQFIVNAAEINLKQIHLGQLAQKNGKADHIKELGKMLEKEHTTSLTDLTALAKRKSISIPSLPTDNSTEAYLELNKKTGKDFDKAYANKMVREHKDAIETFEDASEDCSDDDIRKWAITNLPHMKNHLDRSIQSQKKFGNMYIAENKQYIIR
ncbi:MAG: DUF4142 domain-containing protein [Brumimicrobium sp.]